MDKKDASPVMLVFGLSGVGKTSFGELLEVKFNFLHIEQDEASRTGPHYWPLVSDKWHLFLAQKNAGPLYSTLQKLAMDNDRLGAVLTFDSFAAPSITEVESALKGNLQIIILHGKDEDCLKSFIEREHSIGRDLDENHWHRCNDHTSQKFNRPEYEPYRWLMFENHVRISNEVLVEKIEKILN